MKQTHASAFVPAADKNQSNLTKAGFEKWAKDLKMGGIEPKKRLFTIIAQQGSKYIENKDFKPLFKHLLENHPGLEFLQATPEF